MGERSYDEIHSAVAGLTDTLRTPLRRDIFEYLRENPGAGLDEIYGAVYSHGSEQGYGPLDLANELSEMPYISKKVGETLSREDLRYEVMAVGEVGIRSMEVFLEETGHLGAEEKLEELESTAVSVDELAGAIEEKL